MPDTGEMLERAAVLHRQGNLAEAELLYREILRQQPDEPNALHLLGAIALQTRHPERAVDLIGRALALKPNYAEAHGNRGLALEALNRPVDALVDYDIAIALKPDFAEAYYNRGNALDDLARPDEALASYDNAIALDPAYARACVNRGNVLQDLKRYPDALESYERAIALQPDFAEAHWNQSHCLLRLGRFDKGWRQYEWRKRRREPVAARTFPQPLWLGAEDIAGKTLFLWWEQGLGDTLMLHRYAGLAQARGARIILSVQRPLHALLQQLGPSIQVTGPDEVPPAFDFHCPLFSLPLAFGTTLATIPAQRRPLAARGELRAAWAARLQPKTKPRIGLVWSGRPEHKDDRKRSIALKQLLPVLELEADWFCLQKEIRPGDLATLAQCRRIASFADELRDFDDTAALLDTMDLIVSVDTGVAHLAGAMGKPVWILLPYNPDWRWLLDRDDSPWYPGARLFHQPRPGDWTAVIDRLRDELRPVVGPG